MALLLGFIIDWVSEMRYQKGKNVSFVKNFCLNRIKRAKCLDSFVAQCDLITVVILFASCVHCFALRPNMKAYRSCF